MLPELTPWQAASLELLGYGNVPRVELRLDKHFFFPRVSYSEFLNQTMPGQVSRAAYSTFQRLRKSVSDMIGPQTQIIYVARTDTTRRVAINEHDLIEALVADGVRVIVPGSLSLAEQIALFGQAAAVIAPHGAGLSNIVFCNPGTIVYEMLPEHYPNYCFSRLAHSGGLHYWADMFPSHGEGHSHERNWVIDIDVVKDRIHHIRSRLAELSPLPVAHRGRSAAMEFLRQNPAKIPDTNMAAVRPPVKERAGFISRLLRRT
jgi:capsular polysaccharide biosynthesis protein